MNPSPLQAGLFTPHEGRLDVRFYTRSRLNPAIHLLSLYAYRSVCLVLPFRRLPRLTPTPPFVILISVPGAHTKFFDFLEFSFIIRLWSPRTPRAAEDTLSSNIAQIPKPWFRFLSWSLLKLSTKKFRGWILRAASMRLRFPLPSRPIYWLLRSPNTQLRSRSSRRPQEAVSAQLILQRR